VNEESLGVMKVRHKVLTVFTIATGKYFDYFLMQLKGYEKHVSSQVDLQVVVATDRNIDELNSRDSALLNGLSFPVKVVSQVQLEWPEITLFRYEVILQHFDLISGDYILWVDADMAILNPIDPRVFDDSDGNVVWCSRHPGFISSRKTVVRAGLEARLAQRRENLKTRFFHRGVLGTWETRKSSLAFVPWFRRKVYVHGAVWGGTASAVKELCKVLAHRTRTDYSSGHVALWHDESHLNWYFSTQKNVGLFPPYFSALESSPVFSSKDAQFGSLDKKVLDERLGSVQNGGR
jgi:hypothetical protein